MLHILWILLKFILILLGILLGLILLAILSVLFCPVRYQATAVKEGDSIRTLAAKARISWLFGAVSFKLQYTTEATVSNFYLFGIPIVKVLQKLRSRKSASKVSDRQSFSEKRTVSQKTLSEKDQIQKTDTTTSDTEAFISTHDSLLSENSDESEENENLAFARNTIGKFFYKLGNFCRFIKNKCSFLWQKICSIPSAIENFTLTIQNICDKINAYKKFLEHPHTKAAFSLIKDKIFKLLKHAFPTKTEGKITFGSTDPSVTGTVLAILGISLPFHQNRIAVTPLFENKNVLVGNIRIKGRIYGVVFLKTAFELYFNKNIKYVIRRWKHKED